MAGRTTRRLGVAIVLRVWISFCIVRVAGICTTAATSVQIVCEFRRAAVGTLDASVSCMLELVAKIWPRALAFARFGVPDRTSEKSHRWRIAWRRKPVSKAAQERPLRHLFAIERLPNGRMLHGYDYRYYCVRCHWLFLVDRHGGVIALDGLNHPLPISEGALRVRTFAYGPCGSSGRVTRMGGFELPGRATRIPHNRILRERPSSAFTLT